MRAMTLLALVLAFAITIGCKDDNPADSSNNAPTITSVTVNPSSVVVGGSATVTIDASDADGDVLNYACTPSGGSISGTGATVTWTAPVVAGTYTLSVTVTDNHGGEATATASLTVTAIQPGSTITVTLDENTLPESVACGETWTEQGVTLSFVTTTAEDCGGGGDCYFGAPSVIGICSGGVDLYPCRLNVDLSALPRAVASIAVDVFNGCPYPGISAFAYSGTSTLDQKTAAVGSGIQTLTLAAAGADRLAVSSCEGSCCEIRITLQ